MINGFSREEIAKLMWEKPYFVQIELTRNCNFKCVFCFENCDVEKKYEDIPYEKWKGVIDHLKTMGVKQIHFSGGENFLHKDFVKIVKYAKELGFYVLINTNGFFNISPILEYADEFVFSLHGVGKKNDLITGMKDTLTHVENNIALASQAHKTILINSVLVKENFEDYLDLFHYLESKYDSLKFSPTIAISCETGKNFSCELEINRKTMEKYQHILNTIGENKLVYKHGLRGLRLNEEKQEFSMPVCAAGKSKLIIKYNGDVYPCNFFQTKEYWCGNVFQNALEDIWQNGEGFHQFRKYYLDDSLPTKCLGCQKKNNCFSGCRAWTSSYRSGKLEIKTEGDVRCELINAFVGTGDNNEM